MSAITGIFYRDGRSVNSELIKKMNDRLSHRGPDGSAVWCNGSVALGHQMLWTTSESLHEKLPFEDEDLGLVITADARIDNRNELSNELDIEDKENISDSYFILKAYEKWGEKCPEKLLGDFAFAIWDKNEEKLFCARDHMGVKPFYYYLDDDMFVFGTEIKSLFSLSEVPRSINEIRIADHFAFFVEDKEITFYEGIIRLPPAHTFTVSFDRFYQREYWFLNPEYEIQLDSDKEYVNEFKNIFTESVRCRLRSAFPIGSMLSGGLDSSSIVCTARKVLTNDNRTLSTFSAIFDDVPQCDERHFINFVINGGNINPNYIHADKISPLSNSDKVLWHVEEGWYATNLFIHWSLYNKAQQRGVRVILDGFDGDTTVSHGLEFLTELANKMQWKKLIQETRNVSNITGISTAKLLFHKAVIPLIPENLKILLLRQMWSLLNGRENKTGNWSIFKFNENFLTKLNLKRRYYHLKSNKKITNSREYHYNLINSGLIQVVLETLDKSAAAFAIESRLPFFDRRLVEFCLAIPPEQKLNQGWDRMILRRSLQDILPPEIQWRRHKSYLSPNFKRNLLLFEKDVIENVIFNKNSKIKNYIDMDDLNQSYNDYKSGKTGLNVYKVWYAVTLALWLDKSLKN